MKVKFLSQRVIASLWFGLLAFLTYFIWSGIFFSFTLNQLDIFKLVLTSSGLLVGFLYGYKTIINHGTKFSLRNSIKLGIKCALLILIFYVIFIVCIDMFKTCNINLSRPMITCYPEFEGFFKEIFIFGSITFLLGGWLGLIVGPLAVIFLQILYKRK